MAIHQVPLTENSELGEGTVLQVMGGTGSTTSSRGASAACAAGSELWLAMGLVPGSCAGGCGSCPVPVWVPATPGGASRVQDPPTTWVVAHSNRERRSPSTRPSSHSGTGVSWRDQGGRQTASKHEAYGGGLGGPIRSLRGSETSEVVTRVLGPEEEEQARGFLDAVTHALQGHMALLQEYSPSLDNKVGLCSTLSLLHTPMADRVKERGWGREGERGWGREGGRERGALREGGRTTGLKFEI